MKRKIQIPDKCPTCQSVLEKVNSQLFCRNKDCSAQSTKRVEAFVKKLKIKGLGPASISKLGFVQPIEIYKTSLDTFVEVLGDKIGRKIYDEIENSKFTNFATFLASLSIPLIGESASKKIAAAGVTSINDFNYIEIIDGIGPVAEKNLFNYILNNYEDLKELEEYFHFEEVVKITSKDKGKVCITGKLRDFSNRTKAKEFLESLGYSVTNSVTALTDYLVDEEGKQSSKRKKAESLGIPIVSIVDLIEEN